MQTHEDALAAEAQQANRSPLLTPDRVLKLLGALWIVCALGLPNLDAFLGGHRHVEGGESFHHRHVFGGGHRHTEQAAPASAAQQPSNEAPSAPEPTSPEPAAPSEDGTLFIADALEFGLEAEPRLSELSVRAPQRALSSLKSSSACSERFYLPCAQRPPPNTTLA